jgi:capsid assembly protease
MSKFPHALDRVMALAHGPWALTDRMLAEVFAVLDRRLREGPHALDAAAIEALTGRKADAKPAPAGGGVALIPIKGVIAPRITLMSDISGGTTFEELEPALDAAVADPRIGTIVFDIDSPGGSVFGAHEFARAVLRARATKPIIAQIHPLGASAAYWVAACCTQIVCSPSAQVGSIGVLGVHEDRSGQLAQAGIAREVLSAGEGKTDGNPDGPLSDSARAQLQDHLAYYYSLFVQDVADGRGKPAATIRTDWKARVFHAGAALEAGLVDRIGTLRDTLARAGATVPLKTPTAAASADAPRDTPQEPPPAATGQDRAAQFALMRAVFDLDTVH